MSNHHQHHQEPVQAEGLRWLDSLGRRRSGLEPMAGDVSSRKYFRVEGAAEILAYYPPDLMQSYECFVRTDELLLRAGVEGPQVLAVDEARRFMLTLDVGDRQLSRETDPAVVLSVLDQAVEAGLRIAGLDVSVVAALSPALETELLTREVRQSCGVFFRRRLSRPVAAELEGTLYEMCQRLGAGRLVPSHRDFMARNMMIACGEQDPRRVGRTMARRRDRFDLIVLDHQDLRLAPWGYDLASLFFDSCPLSPGEAVARIDGIVGGDEQREAVARCGAQRCVKIVGTFFKFAERGEDRYLGMVPRALRTAARELDRLPEGTPSAVAVLEDCAAELDGG